MGYTPIMWSVIVRDDVTLRMLLADRADPSAHHSKLGPSAVGYPATPCCVSCVMQQDAALHMAVSADIPDQRKRLAIPLIIACAQQLKTSVRNPSAHPPVRLFIHPSACPSEGWREAPWV